MIQEFSIKLNDGICHENNAHGNVSPSFDADQAAGWPASANAPHKPRRGRRTKARRNTSLSTASTSCFCDSLSTVGNNDGAGDSHSNEFDVNIHDDDSSTHSCALSTEVSDDLYFEEIEKLIDLAEYNESHNIKSTPKPTANIAAKMQARLLSKHLKTRRLRRVVSHSAAASMQDDVDMLNEVSGATADDSMGNGMRTVFSFSDMRRHDAEEHQMLTEHILGNIVEEDDDDDDDYEAAPNTEFEEFIPDDNRQQLCANDTEVPQQLQATLKPHPKMNTTTNNNNNNTKNVGYIPFFPPPQQPGGLRRANTSAASTAGRAMLATPSSSRRKEFSSIPKPKTGNLQRSKTDSIAHCGGRCSDRNSRKIKEVTVEDFYDLLRLHQSQTL